MLTARQVRDVLQGVLDPELLIDIVSLGLVYEVRVGAEGREVGIVMTLTTMGCPAFDSLRREIAEKVGALPSVERVEVELTFDPPWTKERMTEEARTLLKFWF